MKKVTLLSCLAILTFSIFVTTMANAALGKSKWPIKIQYVTFVNKNHITIELYQQVWDEIEKRSEGRLKFINQGGPEAIKIFAQAMAVYRGATDMVITTPSFMGKLVKGTSMLTLSEVPVADQRRCGLYDYMNEVFNKKNMQFLQMYPREQGSAYLMLSKDPITSIADFQGKSVRGGDYQDAVAPEFGMTTVAMKHFEEYSALEKGLIDIGRMTLESMADLKLYEVAKHLIVPTYGSTAMSWFMNLDKWNSIPGDLQALIIDTMYEMAPSIEKQMSEYIAKEQQMMVDNGVQIFEFQGEEREKYMKTTQDAMFQYFLKENPEVGQKIFDLTRKK